MHPKAKGNKEERKQAKQLSIWMFKDPDVLKRHPTSGTDKSVYSGDVIPMKQLDEFGWKRFGFFIETKSGYENHLPTFYSYEKVAAWYKKARLQSRETNQDIIFLICQFKNRQALLITDQCFDGEKIMFEVSFPVYIDENGGEYAFVYKLGDIMLHDFETLFEGIDYKGV